MLALMRQEDELNVFSRVSVRMGVAAGVYKTKASVVI